MSRRGDGEQGRARRSWLSALVYAALLVLSVGAIRGLEAGPPTAPTDAPTNRDEDYRRELHSYIWGIGLALAFTLVPFALVFWSALSTWGLLIAIGVFAFLQIIAHFRFFLHINPPRQNVDDLHLILFSSLILFVMAGGTIWIMFNLAMRMMG